MTTFICYYSIRYLVYLCGETNDDAGLTTDF